MSLRKVSTGEEMAPSLSSNGESISVVRTWQQRRSLPELLSVRETFGKRGNLGRHSGLPSSLLSYRAGWNPSRLQNMILAVGPGTPASVLMTTTARGYSSSSSSASSSASNSSEQAEESDNNDDVNNNNNIDDEGNRMEDDNDGDEEEGGQSRPQEGRSRWTVRHREEGHNESDDDGGGDDDDPREILNALNPGLMEYFGMMDSDSEVEEISTEENNPNSTSPLPSMRHGGCINTAAWLDCGWRISTAGISTREAMSSEDCPTQLVTSGDDHLVKFWDARQAMGGDSPLPGGCTTICPFSNPDFLDQDDNLPYWKAYYKKRKSLNIAGSVLPLATLHTGHRGNVFHVTPLSGMPGKVATCGADGYLRISDLETGDSSIVVSPEYEDDIGGLLPVGLLSLRAGMCFSHHFLNQHTGLLCSERGLRRFDLRLPPREQPTRGLLGGPFRACKACAVWSNPTSDTSLEEGDSAYVFAGGSSADVALCDLRMADGSSSRVIQRYRPSSLILSDNVSVSGLDLSKDRQELLVSYESDQIYTFPVFPDINSRAGPTVDHLRGSNSGTEGQSTGVKTHEELAAYGGHLNRFTFLKNARYAGPRDEYICTGSDSGHAWIYDKATGSVVSFLNADHSTCNGVIPHPTLPVFITYGIDSTAKLWRATIPVDPDVDDSPMGRLKCYRKTTYDMSPAVQKWGDVQQVLKILGSEQECEETDIMPDLIPNAKKLMHRGMFGLRNSNLNHIGNDLHNLKDTLQQNLYECVRSLVEGEDLPVESDINNLKHRISLIRLRHQADRLGLGLRWNASVPWRLEKRQGIDENDGIHPADLIPDCPSDWIPHDPEIYKSPRNFKDYFNTKLYGDFYRERYSSFEDIAPSMEAKIVTSDSPMATEADEKVRESESEKEQDMESDRQQQTDSTAPSSSKMAVSSDEEDDESSKYAFCVYNLLYETILTLKDAGNEALQNKEFDLAAWRYDKAIQYGAVASMSFPSGFLDFVKGRGEKLKENGGFHVEWGPLIKVLIMSRLNLALLMLKPHFAHADRAAEQARLALRELKPFCISKGKVMKGSKLDIVHRNDEPDETYIEAVSLQAKGYFRFGSAMYEMGEYNEAIRHFENSVKSTQEANAKPDNLVLMRLSEAKRENRRKSKRQKRFKFSFGNDEKDQGEA